MPAVASQPPAAAATGQVALRRRVVAQPDARSSSIRSSRRARVVDVREASARIPCPARPHAPRGEGHRQYTPGRPEAKRRAAAVGRDQDERADPLRRRGWPAAGRWRRPSRSRRRGPARRRPRRGPATASRAMSGYAYGPGGTSLCPTPRLSNAMTRNSAASDRDDPVPHLERVAEALDQQDGLARAPRLPADPHAVVVGERHRAQPRFRAAARGRARRLPLAAGAFRPPPRRDSDRPSRRPDPELLGDAVLVELGHGALVDDAAGLHDVHAVGDPKGERHVLLDHQDRHAGAVDLEQRLEQRLDRLRREARRRPRPRSAAPART